MRGIGKWILAVESVHATDAWPARFFFHGGIYDDVGEKLVRLVRNRCYGGCVLAVVGTLVSRRG